ncbi:MAG: RNA recognition motif domain-containing protein [Candidatus Aminicenantaceae bacterium]
MKGKKLYVGNLDYSVKEAEIKELFSQFGEINDAVIIKDKYTDRSKGFGFIEFSKPEEAQKAESELNGKEYHGRTLKVNEARERL